MRVFCLSDLSELQPYAEGWDRLAAGVPFRSWAWLSAWWRHYGQRRSESRQDARLMVPCVFDAADTLVGVAPWYLEDHGRLGRVVRMFGGGEVCSDYLSLLCQADMEEPVTRAVADFLTGDGSASSEDVPAWDLLHFDGIDAGDRAIGLLKDHLAQRGCTVHVRPGTQCWRIELPGTWDEYLASLSKSHRKQLRRIERNLLDAGRAELHTVGRMDELSGAFEMLVDLHQRRRQGLGQPGCFASRRFHAFHREAMADLLRNGQLQLHWLELDGRPVAAEYHLAAGGVVFAYQSGVEPEMLDEQPGRLITVATVRRAIEQGYRAFDFLRGDEPYKAHFRARPRPTMEVRVVANRASARLRHQVWKAGWNLKQWVKSGLQRVGATEPQST